MDTLTGLAAHILYIFSIYQSFTHIHAEMYSYLAFWEGAAVLIIMANVGHKLEGDVRGSATNAYNNLENLRNRNVIVTRNAKELTVNSKDVKIGEAILVKKGEMIPLDGTVIGNGIFNYANITGESNAVHIYDGMFVMSGAYNIGDAILIKVTKDYHNSTISSIVNSIEEVSMARPKLQQFADKILQFFIPVIFTIALTAFTMWALNGKYHFLNSPWLSKSYDNHPWLIALSAGVTVLAISCPCALGIATPLVYVVSSTLSIHNGIMINEPKSFETLAGVKVFAFDKTGTITTDEFNIHEIRGNKKLIGVAKALESKVHHPIANTIMKMKGKVYDVKNIKSIAAGGVSGIWEGKKVAIKASGNISQTTNVGLFVNGELELEFKFINKIKKGVKKTIEFLKSKGNQVVMITGDSADAANAVAKQVGINVVYSDIKPAEKARIIRNLQTTSKVAFVGDGFNDAVAIKQSDISFAFASGSDITNSLADISIISNKFPTLEKALILSKMNNTSVKIALTYALMFNILTIPLAFLLIVLPWMGATIMAFSGILVSLNAVVYKIIGNKKLKL